MRSRVGVLIVCALLSACAGRVPKERLVEVPVVVAVPAELSADCRIEEPANATVGELLRVANARRISLEKCNIDKEAIRNLRRN